MKFLHSTKFELILNRFCATIGNVDKVELNVRRKAEYIADPLYILSFYTKIQDETAVCCSRKEKHGKKKT